MKTSENQRGFLFSGGIKRDQWHEMGLGFFMESYSHLLIIGFFILRKEEVLSSQNTTILFLKKESHR